MFTQIRNIYIDGRLFQYHQTEDNQGLDIDYKVDKNNEQKTNKATVLIYMLTDATIRTIKKGSTLIIEDGYLDYSKVCFTGVIDSVRTYFDSNNDKITEIIGTPNNRAYLNTVINKPFRAGIKASEIIQQLNKEIPFKIEVLDLVKDITYSKGKCFSCRLSDAVKILGSDTGSKVNFDDGRIYFKSPGKTYSTKIQLSAANGLVAIEKMEDNKYQMQCFIIPDILEDSVLEIKSKNLPGTYKVIEIARVAEGDEFSIHCVMELIKSEKSK